MYSIFHPLDLNERLPRELYLEGRRYGWLEKRRMFALFGALYLPALMLTVIVLASLHVSALVAFGVAGVVLIGVFVYALLARTD